MIPSRPPSPGPAPLIPRLGDSDHVLSAARYYNVTMTRRSFQIVYSERP
jgi:hypothetical protein